jgi:hypothetical protein
MIGRRSFLRQLASIAIVGLGMKFAKSAELVADGYAEMVLMGPESPGNVTIGDRLRITGWNAGTSADYLVKHIKGGYAYLQRIA